MSAAALVWAWARGGRRWHLRPEHADLALCGAGARGWVPTEPYPFVPNDPDVRACLPCLGAVSTHPSARKAVAGEG